MDSLVMCTSQVFLILHLSIGDWKLHKPRIGSWCINVVICSALLSHNAFVLADPNLSAPADGEKPVGQLSPMDQISMSRLSIRSADEDDFYTTTSSLLDEDSDQSNEMMNDYGKAGEDEHNYHVFSEVQFSRIETPFVIGVWILSTTIAKIVFHKTPKLSGIFPESCLVIVVGALIGGLLWYALSLHVPPLTPNTFFFYMLPPIVLNAGYLIPNRKFFENITTILVLAVIGALFNIATIGSSLWACGQTGIFGVDLPFLHILLFSSLIAAVDPVAILTVFEDVNEVLHIVAFGEMLLNYAVTIIMYHMFAVYNEIGVDEIKALDIAAGIGSFFVIAIGGSIVGIIWGFVTGIVTRFTDHVQIIEPIFILVMAYLAYLNAEVFHVSGILAITFCGITMKNYVEQNASQKSRTTIENVLKMLSSSAETIIFMFLGVATFNSNHVWNTWFILLTIIFCLVYRILGVFMLSTLANYFRTQKLTTVDQFVISFGGLRGAVAFALVLLVDKHRFPLQPMFLTTTIAVIFFTMFLQGITVKPLADILDAKRLSQHKPNMDEQSHELEMV